MHRRSPLDALALILIGLLSACPGSLDDPSRFGMVPTQDGGGSVGCADPESVVTNLFETRCGGSGCHGAGAAAVDLVSDGVEARLVDQTSAACMSQVLISSSDPSASYLLNKVSEDPACGSPMPIGGAALSPGELSCLQAWIENLVGATATAEMDASLPVMDGGAQDAEAGGT